VTIFLAFRLHLKAFCMHLATPEIERGCQCTPGVTASHVPLSICARGYWFTCNLTPQSLAARLMMGINEGDSTLSMAKRRSLFVFGDFREKANGFFHFVFTKEYDVKTTGF
jgi:hypothetical protein